MSPTEKDLELGSGLIQARTNVTLTNRTGQPLTGTIQLLDFKTLNETGGLIFTQAGVSAGKYGLAKWMSLPDGPTVTVPDGQTVSIPVVIDNRADLAPGGHYGAVVITFGGNNAATDSRAAFKQELVSLLLIRKAGGEHFGLQLESLKAGLADNVPNSVSLLFKSTGNVHVVPHGYVTVQDPSGKVIAKAIINPDSLPVLPGADRSFASQIRPLGALKASRRYKLTAYYRYDGQANYSTQSLSIKGVSSLLDWWPIAAFAGFVLIALLVRKQVSRKVARRYRAAR